MKDPITNFTRTRLRERAVELLVEMFYNADDEESEVAKLFRDGVKPVAERTDDEPIEMVEYADGVVVELTEESK